MTEILSIKEKRVFQRLINHPGSSETGGRAENTSSTVGGLDHGWNIFPSDLGISSSQFWRLFFRGGSTTNLLDNMQTRWGFPKKGNPH